MTPYAEVIGDPISQSKSPVIHSFWLDRLGIAAAYRATRVAPDELTRFIAARRADPLWRGCNVTIPHKQAILPLVDAPSATTVAVGAANCIVRSSGDALGAENSDVEGVSDALDLGHRPPGITCLIGAGGAALAALYALRLAGVTDLRLLVRRPAQAQDLLGRFGIVASVHALDQADAALAGAATVINASPMGMAGQLPMDPAIVSALTRTEPAALVFDMVYAPLRTELLAAAGGLGRRPVDGLAMLIGQADLAFRLFFGAPPPRHLDAALRALLTA